LPPEGVVKNIDEQRLESDLGYRVQYLTEFMGFGAADVAAVHGAAAVLAPLVPALVDGVYVKLRQFDATWRHFVPRQQGFDGPTPASLAEVTLDHPQIVFRKQHLARYLEALVTRPYDPKMLEYLDMVGKIHTPKAGNPAIHVPLVQMNALLGFVADAVTATIFGLGLERTAEIQTVRAFNKLLWVQNDLSNRHYQAEMGVEAGARRPTVATPQRAPIVS
jgi:hypothetical protein